MGIRIGWILYILATTVANCLVIALCWALIIKAIPLTLPIAVLLAALFPAATFSAMWLISEVKPFRKRRRF